MPTDMDNYWNVNNGKTTSDGEPLFIDFGIDVAATQLEHESDSFDNTYDKDLIIADLPKNISKKFESKPLLLQSGANSYNITDTVQVLNKSTNTVVANMPGEAASAVGNALKATIQDKANDSDLETTIIFDIKTTTATANSVVYNIEATALAVYTDTNGTKQTKEFTAAETDSALTSAGKITVVPLEIGKGLTSVSITHNDTVMNPLRSADVDEEGYFYNPLTGELLIKSITFSPFSIEFDGTSEVVATVNGQNYAKLQYAVMAAKEATDPVTITVKKTVDEVAEFDSTYESKNIVLDLGGNRISGFTAFGGNITVKNGTITGRTNVYDSSDVTLATDVTVSNYVVVWGDGTYGTSGCKTPTLNMYGTVNNNTEYAAITTNGTDLSNPNINVYDGANVTSSDIAVYLPSGVMTVNGGSITGSTGIYFKSKNLTIKGGSITGNGPRMDYSYNSNGANATGDALVIDKCNYPAGKPTVSITGGTFVSVNAKAVGSYAGNGQTEALSGFIKGGRYNVIPEQELVKTGYLLNCLDDYWVVEPDYVAAINDKKYESLSQAINDSKNRDEIHILHDISNQSKVYSLKNVTLNGHGNRITFKDNSIGFNQISNCNLIDIEFEMNVPSTNGDLFLANDINCSNFNNVDIFGTGTVTGNVGAYCWRITGENSFKDCNVFATMTGGGHSNNYNSVFFGIPQAGSNITLEDCSFEGTLKCGSAAMFVANPCYGKNITLNIKNVKNNGLIQTISNTGNQYIQSPNQFSAVNNDGTFSFYKIILDGKEISVKDATTNVQKSLNGSGNFVFGPDDATLRIEINSETKKFVITPASNPDVSYYEVAIGTYVGVPGGSNRNYIFERVEKDELVTEIEYLGFVDYEWVENNPEAKRSVLGNNTIYSLNGESYYLVSDREFSTKGKVKKMEICAVSAYSDNGELLASSTYDFE